MALDSPLRWMSLGETLAYLAGIVDGDGYFKVSRAYRWSRTVHPYYATTVGVSQLWPGEGVKIFATAFGGVIMDPRKISFGRWMARCEVHGSKAESAARRLLPFLQLKRDQAVLLLGIGRLRPSRAWARDAAVALLARTFGGRVGLKESRRPNHRDLTTWSLHDKMAEAAIRALLPYLVVKKTEALHLLQLRRLKAQGKQGVTEWVHANRWRDSVRMRKRCYTSSQVAAFERIRQAVLALHSSVPR